MIAFPQFLGIFFVQFFGVLSHISSLIQYSLLLIQSSEIPFQSVILQAFTLKLLLQETCGRIGTLKNGMIEESLYDFFIILSSMLLFLGNSKTISSVFAVHYFRFRSNSQLLCSIVGQKMDDPSSGLTITEILLMWERRLSPFISLIDQDYSKLKH